MAVVREDERGRRQVRRREQKGFFFILPSTMDEH